MSLLPISKLAASFYRDQASLCFLCDPNSEPAHPQSEFLTQDRHSRASFVGMGKTRLEAFSDGVIAILITIMVLELKVPPGESWEDLLPLWPTFLSYVLSFIYLAIYWNNHHHLLHTVHKVTGPILWANIHLLFWLSLIPFVTAWSGEHKFPEAPTALFGVVLMMAGTAYYILSNIIISVHGKDSELGRAVGKDFKGIISVVIYLVAVGIAFVSPLVANLLYWSVAFMWLIPDRRIEKQLKNYKKEFPR